MELREVVDKLKQDNLALNLYFCRKLNYGNYVSFSPNVDAQIYEDLIAPAIECISRYINHDIVTYSPIGYADGTIENYSVKDIKNYENIEQSFKDADNVETEVDIDKCNFYVLEVKCTNETEGFNIKIFRRLTKFKKLRSKGFIARFNGRTLNKLESKLIGIDGEVDLLIVGEEITILSHYSLERIFNLENQFKDAAVEFLKQGVLFKMIDNFDCFNEECLNNSQYRKMLTKMSGENIDLDSLYKNSNSIKETIDLFELDIEYSENPFCLIYNDRSQIKDILRILRDSYYVSTINATKGINSKIVDTKNSKKDK